MLAPFAASAAHASTSSWPYRYGFPNAYTASYNPHLYWSYGAAAGAVPYLDQRTAKRWQGHVPWGMVNAYLNDAIPPGAGIPDPYVVR